MRSLALVVGTTPDYVELMRGRWPERCLFLTDAAHRASAVEPAPPPGEELTADLSDFEAAKEALLAHLARHGQQIDGVACYDCESLHLASFLAGELGLPFHSRESIALSRNKYLCKIDWHMDSIPCPKVALASTMEELERGLEKTSLPVVLKPLTGAGSELVFICRTHEEAALAFFRILEKLKSHGDGRMYPREADPILGVSPREAVLIEELMEGEEFSCEFVMEGKSARVFRVARKLRRLGPDSMPVTVAYEVPALGFLGIPMQFLEWSMMMAASSIGIQSGVVMADFFMNDGRPYLLEMTPRPSGDCIPHLTRLASGLDTIGLCLDIAQRRDFSLPSDGDFRKMAGLRLLAKKAGTIASVDSSKISALPFVREVFIRRKPGHCVTLPPEDCDSWVLGHAVFEIGEGENLQARCELIEGLLDVRYR